MKIFGSPWLVCLHFNYYILHDNINLLVLIIFLIRYVPHTWISLSVTYNLYYLCYNSIYVLQVKGSQDNLINLHEFTNIVKKTMFYWLETQEPFLNLLCWESLKLYMVKPIWDDYALEEERQKKKTKEDYR